MAKNNGINILDASAKHGIVSEIDTKEYITLHKAKIESLKVDDTVLKWGAEVFDKLGAAVIGGIIGVAITVDELGNIAPSWIFTGILGIASLWYGIYAKNKRNSKIDDFIAETLKDKDQHQPPTIL